MKIQDRKIVVVGIGNEFRSDDAAGLAVVARLRDMVPGCVELVVSDGEPTRLVEAWTGARLAVVVDAVAGSAPASGRLHRLVISGPELAPAAKQPWVRRVAADDAGLAGSHGLGLGTAIGVARALGRMPETLIVHGIGATDFSYGRGLSAAVDAAVDAMAAAVCRDIGDAIGQPGAEAGSYVRPGAGPGSSGSPRGHS